MGEKTSAERIAGLAYEGATLPYLTKLARDAGLDVATVRYLAAVAGMAPATLYKEAHADPQAFRDLYQLVVGRLKQAAGGQQGGGIGRQSSAGSARQEAQLYEMEKRLAAEEAARAGQGGAGTGINRLLKRLGVSPGSNAPSVAPSSGGAPSMNRLPGRPGGAPGGGASPGPPPGRGLRPL